MANQCQRPRNQGHTSGKDPGPAIGQEASEVRNVVEFVCLQQEDLHPDLLADFQRQQVTRRVIRAGAVVPDSFEDDWDIWDKKAVLAALRKSLQGGGAVIAAFHEGRVVGIASIQGNLGSVKY